MVMSSIAVLTVVVVVVVACVVSREKVGQVLLVSLVVGKTHK